MICVRGFSDQRSKTLAQQSQMLFALTLAPVFAL
jgi:hypothetical protein